MNKLLALSLVLFLISCGDDEPTSSLADPETLRVNVDNATFNASDVTAVMTDDGVLSIAAYFTTSSGNKFLFLGVDMLNIYEQVKEGEYIMPGAPAINNGLVKASCAYGNAGTSATPAYLSIWLNLNVAGKITLSEIDRTNKTVSGTFEAQLLRSSDSNTINLTNGSFTKINYTE
jgi:hypothetical protein